jgi:hypothetical protein
MTTVPPGPSEYQLIGLAEDGGIGNLLADPIKSRGASVFKRSYRNGYGWRISSF